MLWDVRSRKPAMSFSGHTEDVNTVRYQFFYLTNIRFFPNKMAFASGSDDCTIKLYDLRGDRELMTYLPPGDDSDLVYPVNCIDFSSSGRFMFAALSNDVCMVFNPVTGFPVQRLEHKGKVSWVRVSPDGKAVATACWDNEVKIFVQVK